MKTQNMSRGLGWLARAMPLAACLASAAGSAQTIASQPPAPPVPPAPPTPSPSVQPESAPQPSLIITVVGVVGKASFRAGPDQPFAALRPGAVIPEGSEILTGPRSSVELKIGAGQALKIDPLSRVLLREALTVNAAQTTRVAMPYGRTQFDVKSTGFANDVQIQMPDTVLAVKGTEGFGEARRRVRGKGGDFNTGAIEMTFDAYLQGVLTSSESSSDSLAHPALNEQLRQAIDPNDFRGREGDESVIVTKFQGVGRIADSGFSKRARAGIGDNRVPLPLGFGYGGGGDGFPGGGFPGGGFPDTGSVTEAPVQAPGDAAVPRPAVTAPLRDGAAADFSAQDRSYALRRFGPLAQRFAGRFIGQGAPAAVGKAPAQ